MSITRLSLVIRFRFPKETDRVKGGGYSGMASARLLGSYYRVFDSHRPTRGVPMVSGCSHLPTPTAVPIPVRLAAVPTAVGITARN
jgi:hypothetical protein